MIYASGILFVTPEGLALFVKRSDTSDHSGEWGIPGGKQESGEHAVETAIRETKEEIGQDVAEEDLEFLLRDKTETVDFATYVMRVEEPFEVTLDAEHTEFEWLPIQSPPEPLHPGVEKSLKELTFEENDPRFEMDPTLTEFFDKDGNPVALPEEEVEEGPVNFALDVYQ